MSYIVQEETPWDFDLSENMINTPTDKEKNVAATRRRKKDQRREMDRRRTDGRRKQRTREIKLTCMRVHSGCPPPVDVKN